MRKSGCALRKKKMQKTVVSCLLIASMAILFDNSVLAQDLDKGRTEYLSKCATCHGADGKGTGPHGARLKTKPVDLTILAKRNKGVFSSRAVYEMIDGRKAVGSHRSIEMPIWGCRQAAPRVSKKSSLKHVGRNTRKRLSKHKPKRTESVLDLACDPEPVIRGRILAVVEYLKRIQEK
jgi:hypothetical protein